MTPAPEPGRSVGEESAEELYEGAPCGYLSTSPDGRIVKVNRTFLEWTGYEREELLDARRFQELLTPGGRIYHETHYAPLLRMQGTVREIAVDIVRADGSTLPALINSVQQTDADGRPLLVRTTVFNATDRRRYEQELVRARRCAERLQEVTARLAGTLEPHAVAKTVVEAVVAEVGADAALFAAGQDPAAATILHSHGTPGPGAQVFPLVTSSGAVGRMAVEAGAGLDAAERIFVETCAAQAAQALERVALYGQARDVASALQQSMLALEMPADGRFTVGTHYMPAVATLEVGGDWYDAFLVEGTRLGLVVGDVVGRGIRAATAMGQLRSAVRALALGGLGPARVLESLDRFALPLQHAQMATVAYCSVDLEGGTVTYACAGHPPPALLLAAGAPRLLWEGRSAPLAAQVGPRSEAQATIEPGSRVVLYTDGLVERRGATIDDGLDRLLDELAARRAASPAGLVEALADALVDPAAAPDDVCLLCAELAGGAGAPRSG